MRVLITAGPTIEPIDPVRYLTNRSSGKMGYALAAAAAKRGHSVLLISGPTKLDIPDGIDFVPVESAEDMYQAVESLITRYDTAIFAAAVADYTALYSEQKIKKSSEELALNLTRTKDILGSARDKMDFTGTLVGFAAETEDVEDNARDKCLRKRCDLVIANDVSQKEIGFDSAENEVTLVFPDRTKPLERDKKENLAFQIIEVVEDLQSPNE